MVSSSPNLAFFGFGFLLGGIVIYDGDPGTGILLVPVGAAILLVAVLLTSLAVTKANKVA